MIVSAFFLIVCLYPAAVIDYSKNSAVLYFLSSWFFLISLLFHTVLGTLLKVFNQERTKEIKGK